MEKTKLEVGDDIYVVIGDCIMSVYKVEKVTEEKALTKCNKCFKREVFNERGKVRLCVETSFSLTRYFFATKEWNNELIRQMDIRLIANYNMKNIKSKVLREIVAILTDPNSKMSEDESL